MKKAIGLVIKALEDKDHHVRTRATASLGNIGNYKAINPLIQMFKKNDDDVALRSVIKIRP